MPGLHRYSIALHIDDGHIFQDNSFSGHPFSKPLKSGDLVAVNLERSTGRGFYKSKVKSKEESLSKNL